MRTLTTLLVLALSTATAAAQTPTIVFLVRHAEKAAAPAADPPLSTIGNARASALTEALSHAGIAVVLITPSASTKGTATPIAGKLGIDITPIPLGASGAAHAQAVADAVKKHAGKAVLIVGNSNTVNLITVALGGPKLPDFCERDYDQLYTLELMPTGPPRFVRSRYGAKATDGPCDAMR